ncbi:MAG: hypothetical protein IEMM0006_0085 [bacterium]|nr:MAG: hypothetical protein IEMM0006_0085 [bacterium]
MEVNGHEQIYQQAVSEAFRHLILLIARNIGHNVKVVKNGKFN